MHTLMRFPLLTLLVLAATPMPAAADIWTDDFAVPGASV